MRDQGEVEERLELLDKRLLRDDEIDERMAVKYDMYQKRAVSERSKFETKMAKVRQDQEDNEKGRQDNFKSGMEKLLRARAEGLGRVEQRASSARERRDQRQGKWVENRDNLRSAYR